jgi:hypothetical protein
MSDEAECRWILESSIKPRAFLSFRFSPSNEFIREFFIVSNSLANRKSAIGNPQIGNRQSPIETGNANPLASR